MVLSTADDTTRIIAAGQAKTGSLEEKTVLFDLVVEEETARAVARCNTYLSEVSKWFIRKDSGGRIKWKRLALHEACVRGHDFALVEALLGVYPLGARQEDHDGRLALHLACLYGAPKEVVQILKNSYPEAVEATDAWGKTPASLVKQSDVEDKQEIIDVLCGKVKKDDAGTEINKKDEKAEAEAPAQEAAPEVKEVKQDDATPKAEPVEKKKEEEVTPEVEEVEAKKEEENTPKVVEMTEEKESPFTPQVQEVEQEKVEEPSPEAPGVVARSLPALFTAEESVPDKEDTVDEKQVLQQQIDELEDKLIEAHSELGRLLEMERVYEKVRVERDEFRASNASLAYEIESVRSEVAQLEKELKSAMDKKDEATAKNTALCESLEIAEKKQSELEEKLKVSQSEVASQSEKVEASLAKGTELQEKVNAAETSASKAMEENASLLKKIKELEESLQQKSIAEKDLQAKAAKLEEDLEKANSEYANAERTHVEEKLLLEAEAESLLGKLSDLTDDLKEFEVKSNKDTELIASLEKTAAECHSYTAEMVGKVEQKLADVTAKAEEEKAELLEDQEAANKKIVSLQGTIKKLLCKRAEEQKDANDSIESLERALNTFEQEKARLLKTLATKKKSTNPFDDL